MNPVLLAQVIGAIGYIPQGLQLIAKLVADIQAGRTQTSVTEADLSELARLSSQSAADIYARLNITPPPEK